MLLQRFFRDQKTSHLGSPGAVPSDPKAMAGRILIMFDGTRGDLQPLVIAARALIEGGGWPKEIFFCLGTEGAGIVGTDTEYCMDLVINLKKSSD